MINKTHFNIHRFDIWDEQNQLIKETYKKDNYSIELINEGEARVIVYFS